MRGPSASRVGGVTVTVDDAGAARGVLGSRGVDGRLADLHDRRAGDGDDDAGRDLQVDGALPEAGDAAVDAAGEHDRGADGEGVLHRLGVRLDLLALPRG